jgi:NADH-quinone oxidoreductase subunit C
MSDSTTPILADEEVREVYDTIFSRFGVSGLDERRKDQAYLKVDRDEAVALITYLKELAGYRHLVILTAVDRIEEGEFRLIYLLHSYDKKHDLGVMVDIPREGSQMDSVHHLWPAAETYQRELREMYGVSFPGSPRLNEDFALEGWEGPPPMRRDFDTRAYSEETYYARPGRETRTAREAMKEKIYPSEAETW